MFTLSYFWLDCFGNLKFIDQKKEKKKKQIAKWRQILSLVDNKNFFSNSKYKQKYTANDYPIVKFNYVKKLKKNAKNWLFSFECERSIIYYRKKTLTQRISSITGKDMCPDDNDHHGNQYTMLDIQTKWLHFESLVSVWLGVPQAKFATFHLSMAKFVVDFNL